MTLVNIYPYISPFDSAFPIIHFSIDIKWWSRNFCILFVIGGWSWFFARHWYRFKKRVERWWKGWEKWGIQKFYELRTNASILKGYYKAWRDFYFKMRYEHNFWDLYTLIFKGIPHHLYKLFIWYRWYWIHKMQRWEKKPRQWLIRWSIKKIWAFYYLIKRVALQCWHTDLIFLFLWFRHTMATQVTRMFKLIGGLFAIFFHWYYLVLYRYMHYRAFCNAAYTAVYFINNATWWVFILIFIAAPYAYCWQYVDFGECCWEGHVWTIYNFQYTKWSWIIY